MSGFVASLLVHGVQGLVNVAEKMNGKLQSFPLRLVSRGAAQVVSEPLQLGHDAIALIGVRLAIPRAIELVLRDRNVGKMPVVRFPSRGANIVGPARDRGHRGLLEKTI